MELLDEHEQSERTRKWLRDNASAILGGIGLGLVLIFGYQWWVRSKAEHKLTAATQYLSIDEAVKNKDRDTLERLATELGTNYADTPYAAMALLQLAHDQANAGQNDAAISSLQQARKVAVDTEIKGLAGLRLARLELASGKADAAIATIQQADVAEFKALAAELRGDALLQKQDSAGARAAYSDALTHLDASAPSRRIVEMKLADLGGSTESTGS